MAERVYVQGGDGPALELSTPSGAIASVVRQKAPDLVAALRREGWEFSGIRLRVQPQAASPEKTLALLLSETDGKLSYVLSTGAGFPLDVSELMPAINAATGGKGGGRGTLAQGMAPSAQGAAETAEQLKRYFVQRLSALK